MFCYKSPIQTQVPDINTTENTTASHYYKVVDFTTTVIQHSLIYTDIDS